MAVNATRAINLGFTGDVNAPSMNYSAADNATSPGMIEDKVLASGPNTITVPTAAAPKAVTIIPPSGNTVAMLLKGVTGDTGVGLHLTDPTSLGLSSGVTSFCLTCADSLTGIRFIWS